MERAVSPKATRSGPPEESEQSDQTVPSALIPCHPDEYDTVLLELDRHFHALAAELHALCHVCNDGSITCSGERPPQQESVQQHIREHRYGDATTGRAEAILSRLDPIERAIMAIPARTMAGLGVKARHAAYVMSQYWEAPIDHIDWDAQAVRHLIEAVCDVARTPLPFQNLRDNK